MNIRSMIAGVIAILKVVTSVPGLLGSFDEKLLELLVALDVSPALLDFLDRLFSAVPDGAEGTYDPESPELIQAFESSPEVREWARRNRPQPPEGTQPLITEIGLLLKYLPILLQLWRAWKSAQPTTT